MHRANQLSRWTIGALFGMLAWLLSPPVLYAQSCALCYQSASSSGPRLIQALKHGILIMLFPPLLIMGAILFAAYQKRNQFNGDESASPEKYGLDEHALSVWETEIRSAPDRRSI